MPSSASQELSVADDPLAHQRGIEDAAVEQHVRGAGQAAGAAPHRAVFRGGGLLAEKLRHLPGDGRVGGIRQAHLLQADAALAGGHLGARNGRQEALAEHAHRCRRGAARP